MSNSKTRTAAAVFAALTLTCQAITHIDLLVAFDTSGAQWVDARSRSCEEFANEQIDRSNRILANSGLGNDFDFRLAGVFKGTFTHGSMNATLDNAINGGDASWSDLRAQRDAVGADIVVILVDDGGVQKGVSTSLAPVVDDVRVYGLEFEDVNDYVKFFAERAFSVVDIAAAHEGYVFAHEVGHVMGAGHSEIISSSYDNPGPQLYEYSSAVMMQGSDGNYYATVMGYNVTGYPGSARYTVLPYFSSPDVVNPETGEALGDATHNNVLTLRKSYVKVAGFRSKAGSSSGSAVTPSAAGGVEGAFTEKKTVFTAALADGEEVVGVAEFVVTATRKGISRVSGTVIGLDGKKKKMANVKSSVYRTGDGVSRVSLEGVVVKGMDGALDVILGNDGSIAGGRIGSVTLNSASIGITSSSARFYVKEPIVAVSGNEVLQSAQFDGKEYGLIPYAANPELVTTGAKWTVAKAGKVKFVKNRDTGVSELILTGENFSGLRLNYQAKAGTFKGAFNVYSIIDGKLKKFKFDVTGIAVNGKGVGIAVCKKAGVSVKVAVE